MSLQIHKQWENEIQKEHFEQLLATAKLVQWLCRRYPHAKAPCKMIAITVWHLQLKRMQQNQKKAEK